MISLWLPVWLLIGLILGVLVNYLADVLPIKRRLGNPICLHCGATPTLTDYLRLRKCAYCGSSRAPRSWLLPIFFSVAVPMMWFFPPIHLGFAAGVILLVFFALVVVTDLEYHLILHPVSIAGAAIGLAVGLMRHGFLRTLLGGLAGFGTMFLLYYLGILFGRYMAKRRGEPVEDSEALGFGDVNLSGVIGLILGWPAVVAGLLLGITLGGLAGAGIMAMMAVRRRYAARTYIPYAPFLVLGAAFLLYPPW